MFTVTMDDIAMILRDFHATGCPVGFTELQRSHYEDSDPSSREVRLIVKAELDSQAPVVIRFKNEADVSLALIEQQSRFAALLRDRGVETPALFQADGRYAKWYRIGDYEVIVTVEAFVQGELRLVTAEVAEKTGALLAETHSIAEEADFHVSNEVLFDPLQRNDLFDYSEFQQHEDTWRRIDEDQYQDVAALYADYMKIISEAADGPRCAVQGDISDCNLYETADGRLGLFDFNRCGDNNLYYDAVMQAVFEARLMDYPEEYQGRTEEIILPAFLRGYQSKRPFTALQRRVYPYLYAVISAFWWGDMKWNENSLKRAVEGGDEEKVRAWLGELQARLRRLPPEPLYEEEKGL